MRPTALRDRPGGLPAGLATEAGPARPDPGRDPGSTQRRAATRVAAATAKTAANPQRRFGIAFVPLGERPGYWTPKTAGVDFEMSPILKPLEPFRKWVTVVSELCDPLDGHATTVAAWLSGTIPKRTIAEDVHNGVTIDQVIARQIGQDTVFPSLETAMSVAFATARNDVDGAGPAPGSYTCTIPVAVASA